MRFLAKFLRSHQVEPTLGLVIGPVLRPLISHIMSSPTCQVQPAGAFGRALHGVRGRWRRARYTAREKVPAAIIRKVTFFGPGTSVFGYLRHSPHRTYPKFLSFWHMEPWGSEAAPLQMADT